MYKYLIAALLSIACHLPAWAHAPYLDCDKNDTTVHCTGGFSDGSSAFGVHIKVLSYDEKLLFQGRLDKAGEITFPLPEEETFYIKFDAGPGHEAEVDYNDILPAQTPPAPETSA